MAVRRIAARRRTCSVDVHAYIQTAKLNEIDPQAWLAGVLARINGYPVSRLHELLPWAWAKSKGLHKLAA
jgi:transposase